MNVGGAKPGPWTRQGDIVDVTSEDSFPASDPPSWTAVVGTGAPCRVGKRVGGVLSADPRRRPFPDEGPIPEVIELAATDFEDYRLKVYGLVENPVEVSLDDLRALGHKAQITLHHCIQGWSGIAEWDGLPLAELIKLVRPRPEAKAVVFHSFDEGVNFSTGSPDGQYYDSHSIANALHPQTLLAYEMNGEPLNHLHGAPLRLRVENQLGFKMVKWIRAIEFVESIGSVGQGEGGYAEDREYFGEPANL